MASDQCCACGGGCSGDHDCDSNEIFTPEECVNDNSVGDIDGDTCSGWYDNNPSGCGNYDNLLFIASERCCVCGGGCEEGADCGNSETDDGTCVNDDLTRDAYGDSCSAYYDAYASQGSCGLYDNSEFDACS